MLALLLSIKLWSEGIDNWGGHSSTTYSIAILLCLYITSIEPL